MERQNWPHVLELAEDLNAGLSLAILKARQMWFTWELAAFAAFKTIQGPNVLAISQGQDYSDQMTERARFIVDHLPPELTLARVKDNTSEIAFKGAGRIKSLPSTTDAGRSLTAGVTIADEAAFHKFGAQNFRAYEPASKQIILCSTANGPHGWFHTQIEEARAGNSAFKFIFYPWNARSDRDQNWYRERQRRYQGFLEDFRREFPSTPEEAFTALSGLVYKSFDPQVHVAPAKVPFEQCVLRGGGIDWGNSPGNPNAAVVMGVTRDGHVHQYDEYVAEGEVSIENMGAFFAPWRNKAPFTFIEADWQNDTGIQVLRTQFRLPVRRALKSREGIDLTDFLLRNNRLTIDPRCGRSIDEFYGYRLRETIDPNTKERYATSTPVDHHADCMDCRRYFLQRAWRLIFTGGATITALDGRPLATRAV